MEHQGTTKAKNLAVSTGSQRETGKTPFTNQFSGDTSGKAGPLNCLLKALLLIHCVGT